MSDHLVLYVDHLIRPVAPVQSLSEPVDPVSSVADSAAAAAAAGPSCSTPTVDDRAVEQDVPNEEEPLIQAAECRICQEEDSLNNLETPCACSGSLKYAHRKCVQHWCNEKGDVTCEICHQFIQDLFGTGMFVGIPAFVVVWMPSLFHTSYQPGYTAQPRSEETAIDMEGRWTIAGNPLDLRDTRLLTIAEAERHFLEAEYDDYAASNDSGAAFCRSAALILLALLLLRHALTITDPDGDDDASAFFSIFLLRAAGFLLPCYIMAWAISILQRRRQRQEAAALAATQVAFVLQHGQHRGLQFAIASAGPPLAPHPHPHTAV